VEIGLAVEWLRRTQRGWGLDVGAWLIAKSRFTISTLPMLH
jgi:hypothetical protein